MDIAIFWMHNYLVKSQTVEPSAFTGLKHVRFLFLPAGVKHLKPDAFSGLEMVDKVKLAYLDLDLTELAPYTFRGIKKLRSLTIENSDLATIKPNAFNGQAGPCDLLCARSRC